MKPIMEKTMKIHEKIRSRRAVAPIIATLLLIAIAVIGGVMIYVFTQGFFGNSAISTSPKAYAITMSGYDVTETLLADGGVLEHAGNGLTIYGALPATPGMQNLEEGTFYLRNVGSADYSISKVEVNGFALTEGAPYAGAVATWGIFTVPDNSATAVTAFQSKAIIIPGETATIVVTFESGENDAASGRTVPIKITSASGSVFNFNVVIGSKA